MGLGATSDVLPLIELVAKSLDLSQENISELRLVFAIMASQQNKGGYAGKRDQLNNQQRSPYGLQGFLEIGETEAVGLRSDLFHEAVGEGNLFVLAQLILPVLNVEGALLLIRIAKEARWMSAAAEVLSTEELNLKTYYLRSNRLGRLFRAGSNLSKWFVEPMMSKPSFPSRPSS